MRLPAAPDVPLLDLRTLKIRSLRVTAAGGIGVPAGDQRDPVPAALFFQLGFGWSAAQAGGIVIALFLGNVASSPFTTPLMRRFGIRTVLLTAILAVRGVPGRDGLRHRRDPARRCWLVLLSASGVFRSVGFSAYNSVAFADVDRPA